MQLPIAMPARRLPEPAERRAQAEHPVRVGHLPLEAHWAQGARMPAQVGLTARTAELPVVRLAFVTPAKHLPGPEECRATAVHLLQVVSAVPAARRARGPQPALAAAQWPAFLLPTQARAA